jgi:predicted HicB family RNase H-like nuclease
MSGERQRRRPGRPSISPGEESSRLHFRIPARLHDKTCVAALRSRRSVSAVIRAALTRYLADDDVASGAQGSVATK